MNTQYKIDLTVIVFSVSLLLVIGLIAIGDFTLQNLRLASRYGDAAIYLKRQVIGIAIGLAGAFLAAKYGRHILRFNRYLAGFAIGGVLILLLMQHPDYYWRNIRFTSFRVIGYVRLGLWMPFFTFPLLAWLLTRLDSTDSKRFHWKNEGVFAALICGMSFIHALLYDLPMLYLFCFTTVVVAALSPGHRIKKLAAGIAGLFPVTILVLHSLFTKGYLWRCFMDRYHYKNDPWMTGYQTSVALRDIMDGGWFGKGVGLYNFPPEYNWADFPYVIDHTIDAFVLQITGREFGIMGLVVVFLLFCLLAASAYRLIGRIKEDANKTFALYLLVFMMLAALIGMVRTCNLLPFVPSMAVPFVAYGAKMMTAFMISLGIIAGLARGEDDQLHLPGALVVSPR